MGKDTLTLALNGEVSLRDFAEAIQNFFNLIRGLDDDVAKGIPIEWMIQDLSSGSAIATIQGIPEDDAGVEAIERVVDAYMEVGDAICQEKQLTYSQPVKSAARKLFCLINGNIKSIRFETSERDVEVFASPATAKAFRVIAPTESNIGAVRGRVDSLRKRGGLRFTLYDLIDDKAISCYLAPGSESIMRDAWGKVVVVEGMVRRDPEDGRPTTVRDVKELRIIREGRPGDYRQAIGAAAGFLGETLPEDAIRRGRDG